MKSEDLKKEIIHAGRRAVEQLIKVAKEERVIHTRPTARKIWRIKFFIAKIFHFFDKSCFIFKIV